MDESKNLVFCGHCDQLVSRSTLERHERKRKVQLEKASLIREESDSDTDSNNTSSDSVNAASEASNLDGAHDEELNFNRSNSSGDDPRCSENDADSSGAESSREDSSTDQDDNEEIWNGILPDDLQQDLDEGPPPLPGHQGKETKNVVHSLVFWLLYFLLIWQTSCHISENGMAWLLRFLTGWLKVLGVIIPSDTLAQIITVVPGSMYMLKQFFNFDRDDFDKYVVCPKCQKLYKYNECLTSVNNRQVGKVCSGFSFSRGKKAVCGADLVYKVQLKNGKSCFYPITYYCYNSIINSLEKLLKKKGFAEKCEHWRSMSMKEGEIADVYDGKIWKDFMTFNGKEFLKAPRNYGFMLNFDFFQPMKRRNDYSVGVFYLVVLNLSRPERFKWENVIVIGIVPSLDKEPKNLNPFLAPAVKELQCLWKGMKLDSALCRFALTFRAAILSASSDVPATRKLGGFKSHSAILGCSRCLKSFPGGFGIKRDYSGFDKENWEPRTNTQHRRLAKKIDKLKTKSKRDEFCKNNGITHYTILLDLEYFDAIRFFTIDPMHNLFLGTAKTMYHLWINNGISKKDLQQIEHRINVMEVPSDIGRIPVKISSNSGCYTAEQWKNWTLIYSLYCLKNILPEDEFKCWQTFVLACKYICQAVVSLTDLEIADGLFVKFGRAVERLYGKEVVKPNMHLHCHMKDIVVDHGPVSSFWCFSFERFNGILGSTPTNKRSVELQLMRRFRLSHFFDEDALPSLFKEDLLPLCAVDKNDESSHWLENSRWAERWAVHNLAVASPMPTGTVWANQSAVFSPSNYKLCCLDSDDAKLLLEVYKLLYPGVSISLNDMSQLIHKYGSIISATTSFGSKLETRRIRSARILASWPSNCGAINMVTFSLTPGTVSFYFTHSLTFEAECVSHTFACVKWYKRDADSNRIGNPVQVWLAEYQEGGPSSFIPVQRIHSRFASAKLSKLDGSNSIAVSPLIRKTFL